jgi:hypothetical protein
MKNGSLLFALVTAMSLAGSAAAFAGENDALPDGSHPVLLAASCLEQCDSTYNTCQKGCQTADCLKGCFRGFEGCKKRCGSSGALLFPASQAALASCLQPANCGVADKAIKSPSQ